MTDYFQLGLNAALAGFCFSFGAFMFFSIAMGILNIFGGLL